MNDVASLLRVIDRFAEHTHLAEATISTRFFSRGTRIAELRAGGDMGARTIRRALEKFIENWPAGVDWPSDVGRPSLDPSPFRIDSQSQDAPESGAEAEASAIHADAPGAASALSRPAAAE